MNRRVASERSAGMLAAPIGNYFVDVHVELGPAAVHPDMQGKHLLMLTCQDLVTGLNDQRVALIVEPFAVMVRDRGSFLQDGVGRNHLAGNQVLADAEMLKRALGLSTPKLVRWHFNDAQAIGLFPHVGHGFSPGFAARTTL